MEDLRDAGERWRGEAMGWGILTQNWICLSVDIEPKDKTKTRIGRVLFRTSKGKHGEYFLKQCLPK